MQKTSTLVGIIIIIVVAVVIFGGVFAYQYFATKTQSVASTQQSNQTAGWKIYTDKEYGFEIKYLSNLSANVDKENGYSVAFRSGTIYQDNITGRLLIKIASIDEFKGFSNCNLPSLFSEQIGYNCENSCTCTNCGTPPLCDKIEKIGDYKAVRFEELGGGFHYLLQNKNNYFEISYFGGTSLSQEAINQMLSTFKFTK